MKQYDLWWAELPLPAGCRPVLLLSRDDAYRYLSRVLVVEVSRNARGLPQELQLGPSDGLPERCVANVDTVRQVSVARIYAKIGRLPPQRIDELKRAVGHSLRWPELTRIAEDRYT